LQYFTSNNKPHDLFSFHTMLLCCAVEHMLFTDFFKGRQGWTNLD